MKTLKLNDQVTLPLLGFGVWQLLGDDCYRAVLKALEVGYRHIDTADKYGNHLEVARALKSSDLKRDEFFITTKVWHANLHREDVLSSGKRFLEELGIEYIDLLLIHWPNREVPIQETLEAMNELKKQGIIRAIGVSNFTIHHMKDAKETGIEFVNNQVELRPSFNQNELREFCESNNITVTSYSTIKGGLDFEIPIIKELAKKYDKTEGQIILNWAISHNIIVIPRSSNPTRIEENFKSTDFELSGEDIEKINNVPQGERQSKADWNEFDY
jgi:2,5-diketo-D-gluconate reductase B